jgi:hypothetical protein
MYKVTNNAKGARMVGHFLFDAGSVSENVYLTEDQSRLLATLDGVIVEGSAEPVSEPKRRGRPPVNKEPDAVEEVNAEPALEVAGEVKDEAETEVVSEG